MNTDAAGYGGSNVVNGQYYVDGEPRRTLSPGSLTNGATSSPVDMSINTVGLSAAVDEDGSGLTAH